MNINFLISEINKKIDNYVDNLAPKETKLLSTRLLQYKIENKTQFDKQDYHALSILLEDYCKYLEGKKK